MKIVKLNTGTVSEGKADFKSVSRRAQMRRKMSLINDRVAGEKESRSQISGPGALAESSEAPF